MKIPIGKHKGQAVDSMSTAYLAWLVTRDNIRFKYWALVKEALRVLRTRFNDFDALVAELEVKEPPPAYWKTPERIEQQKRERAEKLRLLEERRKRAAVAQQQPERQSHRQTTIPAQAPFSGQIIDAGRYLRMQALRAEQLKRQQRTDPDDVSDLV
ncbi:MAG TPA: hypothetical protein VF450_24625 [Noviherbaspirillum sp.]